jgi:hypothetical protein
MAKSCPKYFAPRTLKYIVSDSESTHVRNFLEFHNERAFDLESDANELPCRRASDNSADESPDDSKQQEASSASDEDRSTDESFSDGSREEEAASASDEDRSASDSSDDEENAIHAGHSLQSFASSRLGCR